MPTLEEFLSKNPEAKAEHDKMLADAKVIEAPEAEAKVEPVAEPSTPGVSALALTVLESTSYHATVKAMASEVLRGTTEENVLKAVVATADMLVEAQKTEDAAGEQAKLEDTPATPGEDSGIDAEGNATSVKGIYAMGAKIKEQANKGAK